MVTTSLAKPANQMSNRAKHWTVTDDNHSGGDIERVGGG